MEKKQVIHIKNTRPKALIIVGPTASGKSALAIELAKKFSGEIVNADSRQVYKGMYVGTASPIQNQKSKIKNQKLENRKVFQPRATRGASDASASPEPKARGQGHKSKIKKTISIVDGIPHHLFHFIPPDQYFSVADYKKLAIKKIRDIARRGKTPFLVGGTGLYIWAVVDNLDIPRVPPKHALRTKLERRSVQELYTELKKRDPEAALLTGLNKRRIIRALEVIAVTGKKFSEQRRSGAPLFETLQIGLRVPLQELDRRIEARARDMLERGFLDEIETLLQTYPPGLPAFTALGYRHFIQYLQGELALKDATYQLIRSHKQLARRQLRWLKRDNRILWFPPDSPRIEAAAKRFLSS